MLRSAVSEWETQLVDEPSDRADDVAVPGQQMRAAGFLLTAGGSLAAGIGSMLDWVTVSYSAIETTDRGIDLVEGFIVLALAVSALFAVLISRIGGTSTARRGAAVVVLAAGIGLVGIAGAELLTARDRFRDDAIEEIEEGTGIRVPEDELDVRLGIGIWLTLAGGVMTAAGGSATIAWASRYGSSRVAADPQDEPQEG